MLTSSSGLFRGELRQDNGRVWSTTGKRHTGFYKIQCRYCNSQLIIKNGKRINTYQRCYACNYIFSIPTINFRQSSLPRVCCPKCKIFNEVTLVQNWRCTECNRTFYDENKILSATAIRYAGFYKVQCKYCKSPLTRKNGKRINTYQNF